MRRFGALIAATLCTGCIATWRRDAVEANLLREHYATDGVHRPVSELEATWSSLEWPSTLGCLSVAQPCRVAGKAGEFCFQWGDERACFTAKPNERGYQLIAFDDRTPEAIERWLYERLDPEFAANRELASRVADAQVTAEEVPPSNANSFWAATRAVIQIPLATIGAQVQGGLRRWLEPYVLVNIGGGYERTFTNARGFGEPRDAILLTARLELSTFDQLAKKRANLPVLSAYVGLTGALGVSPELSWGTRVFLGVSAIVPFSVELGYSVSSLPQGTVGQFYVAAGFGI